MQNIDRRNFLKSTGIFAIGFSLPNLGSAKGLTKLTADAVDLALSPYVLITKDNKISILCPRPDMGQGTTQSMPMLVAEELGVSMEQITVVFTNGEAKYGGQLSGGSSSVRTRWKPMRTAGAAAREMLTKAAANKWGVSEADCISEGGKIINTKTKASFSFGELVDDAAKLEVPKEPKLKSPKDFKLIGKGLPRLDIPAKTNGTAQFGIDVKVPNMVYAVMLHAPHIHGKVKSIDDKAALKVAGVQKVLKAERTMPHKTVECVAVIANSTWAAIEGRKALNVEWEASDYSKASTAGYFADLQKLKKEEGFTLEDKKGSITATPERDEATGIKGVKNAAKTIAAEYITPFTAHSPLEPENATAWVQGDKVEIWAPIQGPDGVIQEIAKNFKFKPENIKINVMLMGGAFGRKAYLDYVNEAVFLSKQLNQPVKLTWTREDDLTQGPYRPGMLNVLRGSLDDDGKVTTLEHKIVGSWLGWQLWKAPPSKMTWWAEGVNQEDSPYVIPNRATSFVLAETDIPVLWWRSVYGSTNVFGHESFIDELAHEAKRDPMDLRVSMLADSPRFLEVLRVLKEKSGYGKALPAGQAIGIAAARTFQSIAAHAIIVSKKGAGVKIEKVISVIDCGIAINPDQVRAQTEGNVVMGLSAALKTPITVEGGETSETNFHQFSLIRLNEIPPIEVHIIENELDPSGVGEPGLPPVAPALANAVFNLTGKRIRTLPFDLGNLG
jgi:isoquinoline 1-oxidoreductase subunit beta